MRRLHVASEQFCTSVKSAGERLLGIPRRGVVVNPTGRLVIPDAPGSGWTTDYAPVLASGSLRGIELTDELEAAFAVDGARLSAQDRATLSQAVASKTDIDETWQPPGGDRSESEKGVTNDDARRGSR